MRQSARKSGEAGARGGQAGAGAASSVSWRGLVARSQWPWWLGWRFFAALGGGLGLRLWMMRRFPQSDVDTQIYGDLAKNMLLHGQFAITDGSGVIHSTLIRLPGYPLFLAACFQVFGVANYQAVIYVQIAIELAAWVLLADFVRRIWNERAGWNTLWLAALCPFPAIYTVSPLTESLTLSCICLAVWSLERYLSGRRWMPLLGFTFALSLAALLRPDGALLAFALWPALLLNKSTKGVEEPNFVGGPAEKQVLRSAQDDKIFGGAGGGIVLRTIGARAILRAVICAVLAIAPFGVWTARNWSTFHVFEPLAPRYANDPGEDPHLGWQHWVKTWCLDFSCTYEVYWLVPGERIEMASLPAWAVDDAAQKTETEALIADYDDALDLSPELDRRFETLAQERIAAHPWRSHLLLPVGRLADMALRPRVENLPIDLRWWEYFRHYSETRFSVVYGVVNLVLLGLGVVGLCLRPRFWGYLAVYLVLRSLLLTTVEAPETRYTLEFFPVVFAMGGIALQWVLRRRRTAKT